MLDPKSQELLELLKKERVYGTLTTQDQINSRQNAERILGPDENLFRIDWVSPEDSPATINAYEIASFRTARSWQCNFSAKTTQLSTIPKLQQAVGKRTLTHLCL